MQNVSNLVIPEGNVNTIHDKDHKLIWGRLAYDTKYAGNTIQDGTPTPDAPVAIQVVTGEQTVDVTGKNLFNGEYVSAGLKAINNVYQISGIDSRIAIIPCSPNTQYTATKFENSNRFTICSSSGYPVVGTVLTLYSLVNNVGGVTFTTDASAKYIVIGVTTSSEKAEPQMQVELGSTATDYEPYQGQEFTIDLGSIGLAKIGNYQDYIYKSGDDWYLHKEVGKQTIDSTSTWTVQNNTKTNYVYYQTTSPRFIPTGVNDVAPALSTQLIVMSGSDANISDTNAGFAFNTSGYLRVNLPRVDFPDVAAVKSHFTANPMDVYYALATPTDTQITDTTLIAQLDAVHQFLTRYGYNATVSGNLPMIINKTNL